MSHRELHEANRLSWNAATRQHNSHKGDQAQFFRDGGSTLFAEEIALLGEIQGKSLLHLQCNAGQDTLSIVSKLNAAATGVDISDDAIEFAKKLSADSHIPANFIRADVYDYLTTTQDQFDVVFSSYGAVVWLSDLAAWGKGIARVLKPGGRFVLMEFHPVILMFDFEGNWTLQYAYLGGKHYPNEGVGDYVGAQSGQKTQTGIDIEHPEHFTNPHPSHEFTWGLAEIITALLNAGLTLKSFQEYAYLNGWKPIPSMIEGQDRKFYLPDDVPDLPLMYGLVMEKNND